MFVFQLGLENVRSVFEGRSPSIEECVLSKRLFGVVVIGMGVQPNPRRGYGHSDSPREDVAKDVPKLDDKFI